MKCISRYRRQCSALGIYSPDVLSVGFSVVYRAAVRGQQGIEHCCQPDLRLVFSAWIFVTSVGFLNTVKQIVVPSDDGIIAKAISETVVGSYLKKSLVWNIPFQNYAWSWFITPNFM